MQNRNDKALFMLVSTVKHPGRFATWAHQEIRYHEACHLELPDKHFDSNSELPKGDDIKFLYPHLFLRKPDEQYR